MNYNSLRLATFLTALLFCGGSYFCAAAAWHFFKQWDAIPVEDSHQ